MRSFSFRFGELFHFTFLLPELGAGVGKNFRKPSIFCADFQQPR
jgi:hypothetical protein